MNDLENTEKIPVMDEKKTSKNILTFFRVKYIVWCAAILMKVNN